MHSETFKLEWLPLDEVIPYTRNAKQHPPEQIDQIASSIQAFGFNDPVAVDENRIIIEGHGRHLAARKLGLEKIPVIRLEHLTGAQKTAYILAHNKLCLNTGWDLEMLRIEFEALRELDFEDLSLTGFRVFELDNLLKLSFIPESEPELEATVSDEDPNDRQHVTCPHCQESFYVG